MGLIPCYLQKTNGALDRKKYHPSCVGGVLISHHWEVINMQIPGLRFEMPSIGNVSDAMLKGDAEG